MVSSHQEEVDLLFPLTCRHHASDKNLSNSPGYLLGLAQTENQVTKNMQESLIMELLTKFTFQTYKISFIKVIFSEILTLILNHFL